MNNRNFYSLFRLMAFLSLFTMCFITTSCGDDEDEPTPEPIVEEPEPTAPTFDGRYSGGWWSNAANGSVYTNIPASMTIAAGSSETEWIGEFFYTSNHVSCCSTAANDGTISFTMVDNVITNFSYIGNLPGCPGNFQGEGEVTAEGRIIIQLTGSDCEGEHSGARIELSK
ncbi:MAG: hypothetical protein AAGC88_02945 [Bacteroidota bacterium]